MSNNQYHCVKTTAFARARVRRAFRHDNRCWQFNRPRRRGIDARQAALAAVEGPERLNAWLPYQAARAGLCAMAGREAEAAEALKAALALHPAPAERLFLQRRLAALN